MEKLSFKINEIEGPLDLILQLLAKHKLDILQIEISKLLEQYMDYIRRMQEQDLEVASEFLEMAARLVNIKTVSLLPKHEEEEQELRRELTGQLLEYQACRQAAALLQEQNRMGELFVRAPAPLPVDRTYRVKHQSIVLLNAYLAALGKGKRRLPPPASAFSGIVTRRVVSVASRIIYILKQLYRSPKVTFDSLFMESQDRSELVATFMALLELVKAKRVSVDDTGTEIAFLGRGEEGEETYAHETATSN